MELFETFRTNVALVGIASNASPLDFVKNCLVISINLSSAIQCWVYLICEANDLRECALTVYISTANIDIDVCFLIIIVQAPNIFEFIDKSEKTLADLYEKTNGNGTLSQSLKI